MSFIMPVQAYAASAGDSVATIDIPEDGEIIGIQVNHTAQGMDADGDNSLSMISFGSTNSFTSNDARNVIARSDMKVTAATVASIEKTSNSQYLDMHEGIPVNAGERLHMHNQMASGVTMTAAWILYLKIKGSGRAAVRRR